MSLSRRTVMTAGLATAAAALAGCGETARSSWSEPPSPSAEPSPSPPVEQSSASPSAAVRSPYEAQVTAVLKRYLGTTSANPKHPLYPGAVAMAMVNGAVTVHTVVGDALRYGAGPVELPAGQRVAMRLDSIFDQASITKVYTAMLVLQQVDQGRIDLAAPLADYLPEFGKPSVTISMLLAHTSGLPIGAKIGGLSSMAERRAAVLGTPLLSGAVPGNTFRYSSVGLMVLAQLVENLTGKPLDQAVKDGITGPLGLRDTGFNPTKWLSASDRAARMVATDARSSRGLLRGVVHDDVCNTLGGVAGHAGIFSTASDLAVIGQVLLGGGQYQGKRVLAEGTVRKMLVNVNPGLPAIDAERPGRSSDHGLGVTINQPWLMGKLSSPNAFGHSGFTGTSIVVCKRRKLVLVVLTNRAHPNWSWANPDPVRVAVANVLADALG